LRLEALDELTREIEVEVAGEERVLGDVGLDQATVQLDLRVAQDDGELRPREAAAGRATLLDLLVAG